MRHSEIPVEHYTLNPAHFYTLSGLSWQAWLKRMGIWLEILTDPYMLLMFERETRGGITQGVHRYAKASNKYIGDPEGSSFLQYLDANNLYGWVTIQLFPSGGFNWVDPSEFTPDKTDSYANCDSKGYLLEADVRYP